LEVNSERSWWQRRRTPSRPGEIRQVTPTDGILIIDNHIALHGRIAFTDPRRHLLRLRLHEPPTARTG
jgi:alpha-ketoglutarate-dependent taurine dioxygenase